MKKLARIFLLCALPAILLLAGGCSDRNTIIDQNNEVSDHNWGYPDKYKYQATIADNSIAYNLYLNLRVTGNYKYSNIFVLITTVGPDKKTTVKRHEFTLAAKDGEWYGKGSGNLYSYQMPFLTDYKFPEKGVYTFYIEQNMRDNPLKEVSDVGLRVEKAVAEK